MIDWKLKGECREYDPELFFTPEGEQETSKRNVERIKRAKAVCKLCTVSGNCLDEALTNNEAGVWGGTSWDDRRGLKRRGTRATCVRCERRGTIVDIEHGQVCVLCGLSWRT